MARRLPRALPAKYPFRHPVAQCLFRSLALHPRFHQSKGERDRSDGRIRYDGPVPEHPCKAHPFHLLDDGHTHTGQLYHGIVNFGGLSYSDKWVDNYDYE